VAGRAPKIGLKRAAHKYSCARVEMQRPKNRSKLFLFQFASLVFGVRKRDIWTMPIFMLSRAQIPTFTQLSVRVTKGRRGWVRWKSFRFRFHFHAKFRHTHPRLRSTPDSVPYPPAQPEAFGNATIGNWFILFPSTVFRGLGWWEKWVVGCRSVGFWGNFQINMNNDLTISL